MYALFEEAGKFVTGRVMSQAEASAQVELVSGKRVKVKASNLVLTFEQPAPAPLMAQARALADGMDLQLAWEFAPEAEFGFAELAADYFGASAGLAEQVATLLRLFEAPHYFRRAGGAGKSRFKKAPAEVVQQALAAIEKKQRIAAQVADWAQALAAGQCPQPIREQLYKILFRPDKNAPEYKAVVEASRATQMAPLALLQRAGAIESAYQFHWQRFLLEHFPKGTGFAALQAPPVPDALPLAAVQAYSIDDSHTTEIDDALSVQGLGTGRVTVGIHIAAPGLAIAPGSPIDQMGRTRLSTVYMPGAKITMLPDAVVQAYTLSEGRAVPAVSLYATLDEATLAIEATDTRLERVPIAANLRHDQLDTVVTEHWLTAPFEAPAEDSPPLADGALEGSPNAAFGTQNLHSLLSFLYRWTQRLKIDREQVRGKPETFGRPDYSFALLDLPKGQMPRGDETVQITPRQRGAPLDLIVAEAMILANSTWGQWLAKLGVPAIYRSQASLAPGVKVRMGTKALAHAGIGVPAYAWSTSPLRRYTDLVNQWQIIAAVRHGQTAALAAPFKPKDAQLFAIISSFDAAYSAYNAHQTTMERFWTLRYLQQQTINELPATVLREAPGGAWLVRADTLPLVLSVLGASGLTRGDRVRVKLGTIDTMALDVTGTVLEKLGHDTRADQPGSEDDEDSATAAGPIALALDVADAEGDAQTPTDAATTALDADAVPQAAPSAVAP